MAPERRIEYVPVGGTLPLRVAFADRRVQQVLGRGVEAVSVARESELEGASVLVLDHDTSGAARADVERLARAATAASVPVVMLRRDPSADPSWAGIADLVIGAPAPGEERALPAAAPLDPRDYNPIGFRGSGVAGFVAVVPDALPASRLEPGLRWLGRIAAYEPATVLAADRAALPDGVLSADLPERTELIRRLRSRLAVLDHPSFHQSDWARAGWLARLCAAGVPVIAAEVSDELAALLGADLTAALERLNIAQLSDPDDREHASVLLRRAALRHHSPGARWRQIAGALAIDLPPLALVSVVLATRRQEWLENGIEQFLRQNYEPRELIVSLHGDAFSDDVEERVRRQAGGPVKVVRVDGALTLGEALNAGVGVAEGDVVTKMDDDDYYAVDHIWDLVLALNYTGADLVGKGAEFVYLANLDLTIRRFVGPGESDHVRLGGGAMMARREPLVAIGGWPARNRGEDGQLVKDFKRAGGQTYRTHGFGYILNRHMRDHTWNTYADYFLVQSHREWRGLRFDLTAIEADAGGHEPPN